jgi:aspartate kinase
LGPAPHDFLVFSEIENLAANITVMKFGGTSLEDGPAFARIAEIVSSFRRSPLVIVVSAMSGVTNALIASVRTAAQGKKAEAFQSLEPHLERHLQVTVSLGSKAQEKMRVLVEAATRDIIELLNRCASGGSVTAQLQDAMASQGERLSANLLTLVLLDQGLPGTYVDARRCIITDEQFGNATPSIKETYSRVRSELEPLIKSKRIPVLDGFVAASRRGITTTLGRGSSNYTATLVGGALNAAEVEIWTDVNGVLTADPRVVGTVSTVPELSYAEALEIARLGTQVLHPRMIQPLLESRIPLRICNSRAPQESGTRISSQTRELPPVKTIAHKTGLAAIMIAFNSKSNGSLRQVNEILKRYQTQFDVTSQSSEGMSLTCSEDDTLSLIADDLSRVGSVSIEGNRALVSCIGQGLHKTGDLQAELLNTLKGVDPDLKWKRMSQVNLASLVDVTAVNSLVRRLHYAIFEDHPLYHLTTAQ